MGEVAEVLAHIGNEEGSLGAEEDDASSLSTGSNYFFAEHKYLSSLDGAFVPFLEICKIVRPCRNHLAVWLITVTSQ